MKKKFTLVVKFIIAFIILTSNSFTQQWVWTQLTSAGAHSWTSIASSSDGTKLAATVGEDEVGYIYTSTNSGVDWTAQTSAGSSLWAFLASSSDGTKLAATDGSNIYTSTNSGVDWTKRISRGAHFNWRSIASSFDGTKLAAVGCCADSSIYTSTNSGVDWVKRTFPESHAWESITSSSDGTKLAAVDGGTGGNGGYIYTSTNSGVNWTAQTGAGKRIWYSIASSSDGKKLAAADNSDNGYIYTSTDYGVTWTVQTGSGKRNWGSIASSSDGTKLAALVYDGDIFTSTNSGVDWTAQNVLSPAANWMSITSSSDGTELVAVLNGGYIYRGIFPKISLGTLGSSGYYDGSGLLVPFTIQGNYNTGNVFTAQLSDSTGSFANPTSIGTLTGTSAGSISCIIPVSTPPGSGYRIRVVSSDPVLTSADNGSNISVMYINSPSYVWYQQTSAGTRNWQAIASSADGAKLAAVAFGDYIYTSTNYGVNWTQQTSSGTTSWDLIVSSSDGTKLVAANSEKNGFLSTSTNSGINWTQNTQSYPIFSSLTSSSDGTKLAAGTSPYIYTSTNSGVSWTQQTSSGSHIWSSIASSSDGTKLAAGDRVLLTGGYIYTSTNSGVNWTQQTSSGKHFWTSITSSSDGKKLAAGEGGFSKSGYIYTSTDSGVNWTQQTSSGTHNWVSIASSSDGIKLVAVDDGTSNSGYIYSSLDSGVNWTQQTSVGTHNWYSITSSSDGTKLAAVDYGGYIYSGILYSINIGTLNTSNLCNGSGLSVPFTLVGNYNTGTIFTAQLSDSTGSFANPKSIGSVTGASSGSINCIIPKSTLAASGYRIRILSTNPAVIGKDNGSNIIIAPMPTPLILGSNVVCSNSQQIYTASDINGGKNNWYVTGGTIKGASNRDVVIINWGSSATGSLKLVQTSTAGCQDSTTMNITINPLPKPKINGNAVVCPNSQQTYTSNSLPSDTSLWSVTGGTIIGAYNQSTVTINWVTDSIGTLKLIQTNLSGCRDSIIMNVTINRISNQDILGNKNVVESSIETYNATLKSSNYNNRWFVTGGSIQGADNSVSVSIKWGSPGSGKLILQQTEKTLGCSASDTISITINPVGTFFINAGGDKSICLGDSVQIGNPNPVTGGTPPYKYGWSPNMDLTDATSPNPIVYPKTTTVYKFTVTDARDSVRTANVQVVVNPLPIPLITGLKTVTECDTVNYSSLDTVNIIYSWYVQGGIILGNNNSNQIQIVWGKFGNGAVNLTEEYSNTGCTDSTQIDVTINKQTGVVDLFVNSGNELIMRPIPTSDFLEILINNENLKILQNMQIDIYSIVGIKILTIESNNLILSQKALGEQNIRIDVSGLDAGVYIVRFGNLIGRFVKI